MLHVQIRRFFNAKDRTIGQVLLYGNGYKEPIASFWSVERPWLDNKPYVSCIPTGIYTLVRYDSPSFGRDTWMVWDVADRTYILIHVANYADNVQGCIGLGMGLFADCGGVSSSRKAIEEFYRITADEREMSLTISDLPIEVNQVRQST